MSNNMEYAKNLKNQTQRKKSITITIDETVLDSITGIADEIGVSKNQIISDISGNFVDDYRNFSNPDYYIINSNNAYMPEGHLHMLLGNRASAWGDTKSSIESIKPGSYVFIYMNDVGFIGSGTTQSKFMINDYSLVKCKKDTGQIEYEVWDEYFVSVDFDKTSLVTDPATKDLIIDLSSVVTFSEFTQVSNKLVNRTKVNLNKEEGQKLKELLLNK